MDQPNRNFEVPLVLNPYIRSMGMRHAETVINMAVATSRCAKKLVENRLRSYNPGDEALEDDSDEDSAESENDHADTAGTEHYVTVSKSKLRQRLPLHVGPEYKGRKISRAALEESDEDYREITQEDEYDGFDGFQDESDTSGGEEDESDSAGFEEFIDPNDVDLGDLEDGPDQEIDSDEALGESDQDWYSSLTDKGDTVPEKIRKRGPVATVNLPPSRDKAQHSQGDFYDGVHAKDPASSGEEKYGEVMSDRDSEESTAGSATDDDGDGAEDSEDVTVDRGEGRAELRKIMMRSEKEVVAAMSSAAKADAAKGLAIREQRKTFDSILHLRIRLQKALVSANTIKYAESLDEATPGSEQSYDVAYEAAVKLWATLDDVRRKVLPEEVYAHIGKRKRDDFDSPEEIWDHMERTDEAAMKYRRRVLDKWSSKVRNAATPAATRRLGLPNNQTLSSMLKDALLNSERLTRRARTPRSCAPRQTSSKLDFDPDIYDDADFYQLLLKELVDQRSGDPTAAATVAVLKSEAKTRKNVDRKASKGRKLRYTVHEKIQDFIAPNDQRTWEESAIDRLFGTLFGQNMTLDEAGGSDLDIEDVDAEDEGLKLFRN